MAHAMIGLVVIVDDKAAINPGGHGRITRRSPTHKMVHVDSGEFPGQEVTGWYPVANVEPLRPWSVPVSYFANDKEAQP